MPGSIVIQNGVRREYPYNVSYGNVIFEKGPNLLNALTDIMSHRKYRIDVNIAGDMLSSATLAEGWYIHHEVFNTLKLLPSVNLIYENIPKIEINRDEGSFRFHITSENKDTLSYIKKAWNIINSTRSLEFVGYNEKMLTEDFICLLQEDGEGGHFVIEDPQAVDFKWNVCEIRLVHDDYDTQMYIFYFEDRYRINEWSLCGSGSNKRFAEILKNIFDNIKFMQIPYLFYNDSKVLTPEILKKDEESGKFTGLTDLYREDNKIILCTGEGMYGDTGIAEHFGKVPQNYIIPIYDNHFETLLKEIWYLIYYLENVAKDSAI